MKNNENFVPSPEKGDKSFFWESKRHVFINSKLVS
jgi:hypothetical protein